MLATSEWMRMRIMLIDNIRIYCIHAEHIWIYI